MVVFSQACPLEWPVRSPDWYLLTFPLGIYRKFILCKLRQYEKLETELSKLVRELPQKHSKMLDKGSKIDYYNVYWKIKCKSYFSCWVMNFLVPNRNMNISADDYRNAKDWNSFYTKLEYLSQDKILSGSEILHSSKVNRNGLVRSALQICDLWI